MNRRFRLFLCAGGLMLSLGAPAVKAGINAMCNASFPCTASAQVPVGLTRTINVTWRGELEGSPTPSSTVRSNGGVFRIAARNQTITLGTTQSTVQQTVSTSSGQDPFQIVESLQVPASVTERAHQEGVTFITYHRDFIEPPTGAVDRTNGNVAIFLSPPVPGQGAAPPEPPGNGPGNGGQGAGREATRLEINRLALRFDDDETARVVPHNGEVRATAYLLYSNAGLFDAVWEIATPATTRGEPVFRPLHYTRRYLGVGREAVLQSPELPSDTLGLYLLRLRINQPQTGFEAPVIRYMVRPDGAAPAFRPAPVRLGIPAEGAALGRETVFRWSAIAGASAYQLELYERPLDDAALVVPRTTEQRGSRGTADEREAPSTGIVVPGGRTELQLSAMTREHLQPGRFYHWRIIAVNDEGRIIGVSPLREIRVP